MVSCGRSIESTYISRRRNREEVTIRLLYINRPMLYIHDDTLVREFVVYQTSRRRDGSLAGAIVIFSWYYAAGYHNLYGQVQFVSITPRWQMSGSFPIPLQYRFSAVPFQRRVFISQIIFVSKRTTSYRISYVVQRTVFRVKRSQHCIFHLKLSIDKLLISV